MAFKEKISHNQFIGIRWLVLGSFWIMAVVSTIFVLTALAPETPVSVFGLFDIQPLKVFWLVMSIAWEGGVLVVVVLLKSAIVKKEHWTKIAGLTIAYLVMASITFFGSIGFNLANTNQQTTSAKAKTNVVDVVDNSYQIGQLKKANERLDGDIAVMTRTRDSFDDGQHPTALAKEQKKIDDKAAEQKKNNAEITKLSTSTAQAKNVVELASEDIFKSIGTVFSAENWVIATGAFFKSLIYIVFGLVVLLMVALAAPTVEETLTAVKLSQAIDVRSLEKYLQELFNVTGRRLAKDEVIVEKTGLTIEQCKEFRAFLMKVTYQGRPLLTRDSGGTKSNFKKEHAIKIACFCARVGKTNDTATEAVA